MKKTFLLLSFIVSVLILSSCSLFGVSINEKHFPDAASRGSVKSLDSDKNGYLSKKELEDATSLIVWEACYDLSGVEYLTNLESLTLVKGADLSGIEHLTNLKSLEIGDKCPDLSVVEHLTNLEQIQISDCVFSDTFVFDNEASVTNFIFRECVFENGVLFRNDSVEYIEFGYVGTGYCEARGDFVFADCDALFWFTAGFDAVEEQNYTIDLSGCDNLDWISISNENAQINTSVDLSNCSKLRAIAIYDLNLDDETELSLNISGSPNLEAVNLPKDIKFLDIRDCPHLISASEQTPHSGEFHLTFIYESDDGYIETDNEQLVFIK